MHCLHAQTGSRLHDHGCHHYNQAATSLHQAHLCWSAGPACCSALTASAPQTCLSKLCQLACRCYWRQSCCMADLGRPEYSCRFMSSPVCGLEEGCTSSQHVRRAFFRPPAETSRGAELGATVTCASTNPQPSSLAEPADSFDLNLKQSNSEEPRQGFYRLRICIRLPPKCAQRIYICQRPSLTYARELDTSMLVEQEQ